MSDDVYATYDLSFTILLLFSCQHQAILEAMVIHYFLCIYDTHDVQGHKRCCRCTEINEFEVTENINSCQVIVSDTCLASGRSEGRNQLLWKVSLQKQWL